MDHIWCLFYFDYESPFELWFFSTEEKAKEAMENLLPGRNETRFTISKRPFDSLKLEN